MDEIESAPQSFIVRVWVEERAEEGGQGIWHGHITHVSSGRRRYLKHLDEIGSFIASYLEAMDIKSERGRWISRWLKHMRGKC